MYQRTLELSESERAALIEHRNHDPRPDVRERCAAVLKVAEGQSAHDVAAHGLLRPRDPDTVYDWLTRYEEGGLDELMSGRQGGNRRGPFPGAGAGPGATSTTPRRGGTPRGCAHG